LNDDPRIDAYLVQLPLPNGLDETAALLAVDPAKDVDGLHPVNLGRLVMGAPGPVPCTPAGIVELLVRHGVSIEGQHVVIIGGGEEDVAEVAGWITPRVGGVGPMTRAMLLRNAVLAAERRAF